MKRIDILTLFPEFFEGFLHTSIIRRAIEKKLVEIRLFNFRDYSKDRLKRVDSAPIGGGAGMILQLQPILDCLQTIRTERSVTFLLSAKGEVFNQQKAHEMLKIDHLILICGHYEGVDERLLSYIDGELCIGDFILTGGELGACVVSDALIRLIDGVIRADSTRNESFENHRLEYPQYAPPREYDGQKVPDILYSGDHQAIARWRFLKSVEKTMNQRPDLLLNCSFTKQEEKWLKDPENEEKIREAIEKAHKFMK